MMSQKRNLFLRSRSLDCGDRNKIRSIPPSVTTSSVWAKSAWYFCSYKAADGDQSLWIDVFVCCWLLHVIFIFYTGLCILCSTDLSIWMSQVYTIPHGEDKSVGFPSNPPFSSPPCRLCLISYFLSFFKSTIMFYMNANWKKWNANCKFMFICQN